MARLMIEAELLAILSVSSGKQSIEGPAAGSLTKQRRKAVTPGVRVLSQTGL
jgi:hypothetical protein